jgi:RNA polymerase sigma factor (sigma-70 family)
VVSDDELLAAWRSGDQRAGSQLFSRHFRRVRTYFINKLDDENEVEELVQATFAACVAARDRMGERAGVAAYLLGIARNLLFKYWRERSRHAVGIEEQSIASLGAGPSSIVARNETDRCLLRALQQIPLKYQEVLELYYWEGLTGKQLAEVLGVGEDTARSSLHRAKRLLGKELRRIERFGSPEETTEENLEDWASSIKACIDRRGTPEPEPEPA